MPLLGLTGYQALSHPTDEVGGDPVGLSSFLGIQFVCFGYGLLNVRERPADGLGDFACDVVVEFFFADRLGIFEPCDGFGGGGFLAGGCALGGV